LTSERRRAFCTTAFFVLKKENIMPPFVYSLAFWQALVYVIAALVAYFTPYKLEAGVLLLLVLAVLKMFNIVPELRAKGFKGFWK
jgi:hypothetical protein